MPITDCLQILLYETLLKCQLHKQDIQPGCEKISLVICICLQDYMIEFYIINRYSSLLKIIIPIWLEEWFCWKVQLKNIRNLNNASEWKQQIKA